MRKATASGLQTGVSAGAMQDFNWNDLKFFVAVARFGNPTAAARLLRVDHNTVRRRVSTIEADLNVRLFDRRDERHLLTDEGETLLRLAEAIETEIASIHSEVAGRAVSISGTVHLGVPDGLATLFVAPRLAKLRDMYPNLGLELVVTSRNFDLSKREADLAIMVDRPQSGRMTIKKLGDVTMRLHAARSYLDRTPRITTIADLARHSFVGGVNEIDFGPELNKVFDAAASFSAHITCTSSIAQLKAAAAGAGICAFANFIAQTEPELVPVLPDKVAITREIWRGYHSDLKGLARIKAVADFLAAEFVDARDQFA